VPPKIVPYVENDGRWKMEDRRPKAMEDRRWKMIG